ncbi:hypothetical protein, partial [Pengzhenrongella sp.]|uniref:hypothetical protein n=1 Tax=Pengzhenrongella sp. TaxID=2888820 RepID=UPI002F945930
TSGTGSDATSGATSGPTSAAPDGDSPAATPISKDDLDELTAALGDTEALEHEVGTDMAGDATG